MEKNIRSMTVRRKSLLIPGYLPYPLSTFIAFVSSYSPFFSSVLIFFSLYFYIHPFLSLSFFFLFSLYPLLSLTPILFSVPLYSLSLLTTLIYNSYFSSFFLYSFSIFSLIPIISSIP